MKHLSWNCRGLGNPATIRALLKCLEKEVPDIVFLMETKQCSNEMRKLNATRLGFEGCFVVDCEGLPSSRRGGLCMLWRQPAQLELISYSTHHVMFRVRDGEDDWFCSGIYGWPGGNEKEKTWDLLSAIKRESREAWLCMGDFNEVMWSFEKRGGNSKSWNSMKRFRDVVSYCGLMDLGFTGPSFTWSNGRQGEANIRERLDRALANPTWKNRYQIIQVKHLPRYKSDHAPVSIVSGSSSIAETSPRAPRNWNFKFEHTWMHHPRFQDVMKKCWDATITAESFQEKITKCGVELTMWAKKEFGSIKKQKKELTELLAELQKTDTEGNQRDRIRLLEQQIDQILKKEETMWYQRSRAIWLKDGDKNSSFFHQKASHRKRKNTINMIRDEEGIEYSKIEEISKVLKEYFLKIFTSEAGGDMTRVLGSIDSKVTSEMNDTLSKPYTKEEVIQAIKQMHPDKAPGPDGMTPFFYQKFWFVVQSDVLSAILGILNCGHDPTPLNHTNIVLIPKVKKPSSPKEYRPISLCNVIFRIITKTIANRVKLILSTVISESQSAFLPGRAITDNAMAAFEIFHTMKHKKGKKGFLALKLDMSKAYDRVEWNFLEATMLKLGFNREWVALVMRCVRTVSYGIVINGSPTDTFYPERGLRQGDPLSPYLFLLCAEAFTALLRQAESEKKIHGIAATRGAPVVSHLFFADDTILFARATLEEALTIKQLIAEYENASGQRINLDKTEITVSSNISGERRRELSQSLGVKEVENHGKYLGLPTFIGRSKKHVFAGIVERVSQKLKDWKEKSLSQAGKEVLLKAVIQAIPSYAMNCFLLPLTTCQEIEKEVARFFWGSTLEERKCHWANWNKLTTAKTSGGMGFRELHFFNLAMLGKQMWGIMQNPNTLSARILRAKYFPRGEVLKAGLGFKPSYLWRSLLRARELIYEGMAWTVGNGKSISICKDRWVGAEKLQVPVSVLPAEWNWKNVDSIIEADSGQWNETAIEQIFELDEARQILSMPRPLLHMEDQLIWRFTKQGWYSVKSAYYKAKEMFSENSRGQASSSITQGGWAKLWKIHVIPRVRLFLWRACADALPVRTNLVRRGCSDDAVCTLCGEDVESTIHMLLYCREVQPIWYVSSLRLDVKQRPFATFRDFLWTNMEVQPQLNIALLAYIAWEIWNRRNAYVFEGKKVQFHDVMMRATQRWMEDELSQERSVLKENKTHLEHKWIKPNIGALKLNTDVAVWPNGVIGLGFVLRDHWGHVVLAGKSAIRAEGSSTILEGLAVRYALQKVVQYRQRVTEVECDNYTLVQLIKAPKQMDLHARQVVLDVKWMMEQVGCKECRYIPRQANMTAHHIVHGPDFISINHSPEHVIKFLDLDVID